MSSDSAVPPHRVGQRWHVATALRLFYAELPMPTPQKQSTLSGLFAGCLPLLLMPLSLILLAMLEVDHLLAFIKLTKGPADLFWVSGVCALALVFVLFHQGSGHPTPLLLPVTVALVPWLVSVRRAHGLVTEGIDGASRYRPDNELSLLLEYTYKLLEMQLLGAWVTATLLVACVGGLVIRPVDGHRASSRGTPSPRSLRALEIVGLLLLGGVLFTRIVETRGLAQIFGAVAYSEQTKLAGDLEDGAWALRGITVLYPLALGALALSLGALGVRRRASRPGDLAGLVAPVGLGLLMAGALWSAGRPLDRMEQSIEAVSRPSPALADLQLLPLGESRPINALEVIVTPGGLSGPGGTQVEWSAGEQALVEFLLSAHEDAERSRPVRTYRLNAIGAEDSRTLWLALDARLTTHQLRRLIDASIEAKLHGFDLLTKRDLDSQGDVSFHFRAVSSEHPLLRRLGATMEALPGTIRAYLPLAFEKNQQKDRIWVGEVGAEREVRLLPWAGREGQKPVILSLSGAEQPLFRTNHEQFRPLYLHVKEEAALLDVASALRQARRRGFLPVLTTAEPSAVLPRTGPDEQ